MLAPIDRNDAKSDKSALISSIDEDSNDRLELDVVDNKEMHVRIKKKKTNKIAELDVDIPLLEELELATADVRCNPLKILASMKESGLKQVLLYRELSKLRSDLKNLEIIQPNDEFCFNLNPDRNEDAIVTENILIE